MLLAAVLCLALAVLFPAVAVLAQTTTTANSQSLVQITCTLSSGHGGGNFTFGNFPFSNYTFPSGGIPSNESVRANFNFTSGFAGNLTFAGGNSLMNESDYSDISSIPNVVAVVPVLQVAEGLNQTLSTTNQRSVRGEVFMIVGIPLEAPIDSYLVLPTNITAGRTLQSDDSDVVLLSEYNSALFEAGVGDTVTIMGKSFTVVGVYGASSMEDNAVYMSLSDSQTLTNNTGRVSSLEVFTPTEDAQSVVSAIKSLHPELSVVIDQTGSSLTTTQPTPVQNSSAPSSSSSPESSAAPSTASLSASASPSSSPSPVAYNTGVAACAIAVIAVIVVVIALVLAWARRRKAD